MQENIDGHSESKIRSKTFGNKIYICHGMKYNNEEKKTFLSKNFVNNNFVFFLIFSRKGKKLLIEKQVTSIASCVLKC